MELPSVLSAKDVTFADTVDVVVIGFGASGACAAIEAKGRGADVLVLERASGGGGNTALSGGYIYLGGGTHIQKANGFDDTVEDMFNYLMANTPHPDAAKIRLYCERSIEHLAWLEAQGVPFNERYCPGKHVEHHTTETLAWTGNEKVWLYKEKARPFPRGHMVEAEGAGGNQLMKSLIARAEALGIRVEPDAGANALVRDVNGRIVGVRYKKFGEERVVGARKGVVIAAGGFASNRAMVEEFAPYIALEGVGIVGVPQAEGWGQRLGASAGGQLIHMDGCLITSPLYPPASLIKGILVNKAGQRFVTEDSYHGRSSEFILRQPDHVAWLIVDNACFERPMFGQPVVDAWETVEEMEHDLGIPKGALVATLARYNANAAKGEDPDFHKSAEFLAPLTEAPFAAIDMTVGKAHYGAFTLGGLRTSIDSEVLDAKGQPIPGLYAAGASASNFAQDSTGYSSGTCIGESTFFGRLAGLHAGGQPAARIG